MNISRSSNRIVDKKIKYVTDHSEGSDLVSKSFASVWSLVFRNGVAILLYKIFQIFQKMINVNDKPLKYQYHTVFVSLYTQ